MLVCFHIKPHCEHCELRRNKREEGESQSSSLRCESTHSPKDDQTKSKAKTYAPRQEARRVEEDEWMEVTDNVLLCQSPEEQA